MERENDNEFNDEEVLGTLSRITKSPEFKKAYRLRQLLLHLVNKQLDGESDDLKGYNIGLDVFEKGKDFDPDSDTIVRVQMVRLRRMLEHYYLTAGKEEPIIIDIPKGRYVPAYSQNLALEEKKQEENPYEQIGEGVETLVERYKQRLWKDPFLSILVMGVISLVSYYAVSSYFASRKEKITAAAAERYSVMPTGPSIAVFPFNNETAKSEHDLLIRGIPAHIIHSLTRFKELKIFAPDTTLAKDQDRGQQLNKARRLRATYALIGGFAIGKEKLVVSTFLMRGDTGQIIWSKDYNKDISGDNLHQIQTNIAASIARKLGQPYGIINRLETVLRKRQKNHSFSGYECVLQFFDYALHEDVKKHLEVRSCLEQTVEKNSDNAQAWGALSWMYVDEYRHGFNKKLDDKMLPMDRALWAARKAVQIDPDDAFSRRRLADVLIIRGSKFSAREEILRAVALNPNDADVTADVGWILKSVGEWEMAIKFSEKAILLNPGHPAWYLETPALFYYKNKNCEKAPMLAQNYYNQSPPGVLREIFMIITAKQCGKKDPEMHVDALNNFHPSFLEQPRTSLKNLVIPEGLIAGIIEHLRNAGVRLKKETPAKT